MLERRDLPDRATLRLILDYDPETGGLFWKERPLGLFKESRNGLPAEWSQRKWNTRYAGKPAFRKIDSEGYFCGSVFHYSFRAHRVIWKWMTGEDARIVDHVSGERSDNSWPNLRNITSSVSSRNLGRMRRNTSGITGVSYNKRAQRWVAYIEGRYLGYFLNLEDARAAREAAGKALGYHPNHGR